MTVLVCCASLAAVNGVLRAQSDDRFFVTVGAGLGKTHGEAFYTHGSLVGVLEAGVSLGSHMSIGAEAWRSTSGLVGDCVSHCDRTFPRIAGGAAWAGARVGLAELAIGSGLYQAHSDAFGTTIRVGLTGHASIDVLRFRHATVAVAAHPLLMPKAFGTSLWVRPFGLDLRIR